MNKFYDKYLSGKMIGSTLSSNGSTLNNGTVYDEVCPDCSDEEFLIKKQNSKDSLYPDSLISYKINNCGYRSDDLNKKYSSQNFLFSGCSYTFGTGIPYESIWAHQLNRMLGGEKFINLGMNSGSYHTIVYDVYNYIRNFGKPKGVFLLFPNMQRHINFNYDENDDVAISIIAFRKKLPLQQKKVTSTARERAEKILDVIKEDVNIFDFYNTVIGLEEYLYSLGIPLVWSTWDKQLNEKSKDIAIFNNYVNLDNFEVFSKVESLKKPKEFDNQYWNIGRDFSHPGTSKHVYYATLMYDAWKDKYEKTN